MPYAMQLVEIQLLLEKHPLLLCKVRKYILSHGITTFVFYIYNMLLMYRLPGRFRHPYNIMPSTFAKIACRFFHPTSSLASACGMQVHFTFLKIKTEMENKSLFQNVYVLIIQ